MARKPSKQDTPVFEDAMNQLQQLVETMEKGELSLDDSLKAFEEGVKLTRICQQSLQEAEQKVMILSDKTEDAALEPFVRDN